MSAVLVLAAPVVWRVSAAQPQPDPLAPGASVPTAPVPDAGVQPDAPTEVPVTPAPATPAITAPLEAVAPEPDPEPEPEPDHKPQMHRNFAGSIQLDYMSVATEKTGRDVALDGATAEVSMKLAMDFSSKISANVKMCVACHGVEVGMAYFDIRLADEMNVRVGRFTPSFGEFPVRHDPANHRTSDKPLPYDMGRMLRITEWNEGVLPAPWVDNGIEINGTHFFGEHVQTDYAVYAIGGPRAGSDPVDFDFKRSRSGESYYIDNNSRPAIGGQLSASIATDTTTTSIGASMMRGTYDPEHRLPFAIYGAHAVFRVRDVFLRAEYLWRRTKMSLGDDPMERFRYAPGSTGMFDPYFVKDGAYAELEIPAGPRVTLIWREDGMRRRGNVVSTSDMRSDSAIVRHTAGIAIAIRSALRLKASYEYYDFSDYEDESVLHLGIAGPF
ncbi:MAG TPA: hypothetical protein VMZ53_20605 [Kofleriaceae bacterium]|nr:hypothetical protein [Kofleriaceae bacterium]